MRTITLVMDHAEWVDGKLRKHKAGDTIEVSNSTYEQIVAAVVQTRVERRTLAAKTPGSTEYYKDRK